MTWAQFVDVVATIVYWMLLWALLAIPATLLILAVAKLFPHTPRSAAAAIVGQRPHPGGAWARFKEGRDRARARLELGTVRILLDRKHMQLKRELGEIRATLDRRLQMLTQASRSTQGMSLVEMLGNFKGDTDRALQFDAIDDEIADISQERASARFRAGVLIVITLLLTVVNSGLLYLFFDELFAGLTVPYLGVELALVVAILFPVLEMSGGIGSELVTDKASAPATKIIVYTIVALLAVALGSLEFMIFYQLFAGAFEGQPAFASNGILHALVACVGPALTLAEAMFGFGIARNLLRLRELGAIQTIKDHVTLANRFVEGLEGRYDRIEDAASRARQSVDDFASQVRGRGEAEMPVVTLLAEQRTKFLESVDTINPGRWQRSTEAGPGDSDAVAAYAWFLPIGITLVVAVFALVFAPAIRASGLLSDATFIPPLLAVGAAMVALIAGGALFDRATSAVDVGDSWKDVMSPRDGAFKVMSVIALSLLAGGVAWICVLANGIAGLGLAAILIALLAGLCWASSFADLAIRGAGYLATVVAHGCVWAVQTALRLAWTALLFVGAALAALALFVLHVLAWPITIIRNAFARRQDSLPVAVAA